MEHLLWKVRNRELAANLKIAVIHVGTDNNYGTQCQE